MKISGFLVVVFGVSLCHTSVVRRNCQNRETCEDFDMHPLGMRNLKINFDQSRWEKESSTEYWIENGKNFVQQQLKKIPNKKVAKNVIFFIGDGMGVTTLAAARLLLGGEEKSLSFENFPYTGLVQTYCLDKQVPDSASTATAYLNGVKGNYGTIGVNGKVNRFECRNLTDKDITHSIAEWALKAGKNAGIVTTTRVTHASPAGTYAKTANRDWENDSEVKKICTGNNAPKDIASQLIEGEIGSKFKVILGGGRREFLDKTLKDEEGVKGKRSDGKNLIEAWQKGPNPQLNRDNRTYVWNRGGLLSVDASKTDYLLGLFESSHMLYHLETIADGKLREKPTLEEMTQKAIEILRKKDSGYFLFVEGGKIDLAHHSVNTKIALDETIELSKAVQKAVEMTNSEDTLIVVSSDHSHTLSYGGYPKRGNDIFGVASVSDIDQTPYMTLSYANGKAMYSYFDNSTNTRIDPNLVMLTSDHKMGFPSTVYMETETHGGEDVAVFASGPWSHLFSGVYEQNLLPHMMAYASCVGDGRKADSCDKKN